MDEQAILTALSDLQARVAALEGRRQQEGTAGLDGLLAHLRKQYAHHVKRVTCWEDVVQVHSPHPRASKYLASSKAHVAKWGGWIDAVERLLDQEARQ